MSISFNSLCLAPISVRLGLLELVCELGVMVCLGFRSDYWGKNEDLVVVALAVTASRTVSDRLDGCGFVSHACHMDGAP
jgi:hypothetical protein